MPWILMKSYGDYIQPEFTSTTNQTTVQTYVSKTYKSQVLHSNGIKVQFSNLVSGSIQCLDLSYVIPLPFLIELDLRLQCGCWSITWCRYQPRLPGDKELQCHYMCMKHSVLARVKHDQKLMEAVPKLQILKNQDCEEHALKFHTSRYSTRAWIGESSLALSSKPTWIMCTRCVGTCSSPEASEKLE